MSLTQFTCHHLEGTSMCHCQVLTFCCLLGEPRVPILCLVVMFTKVACKGPYLFGARVSFLEMPAKGPFRSCFQLSYRELLCWFPYLRATCQRLICGCPLSVLKRTCKDHEAETPFLSGSGVRVDFAKGNLKDVSTTQLCHHTGKPGNPNAIPQRAPENCVSHKPSWW